jgi:acetyl esterase
MSAMAGEPPEVGSVEDRTVPGPAGDIPVRVYRPDVEGPAPILVFLHGGGWVIGNLDSHDVSCRALCKRAEVVVVSVDYRLAPEHPHPAASDDAWAALTWVAAHGDEVGGDASRLAVGGDSAGGNLAALMALRARDEGGPALRHQMLIYPVTDLAAETASHVENGEGYFLTTETMRWFIDHYLGPDRAHGDPADPAISPLRADDLSGLPPAQVLTAEFDPLRDEGDAYAARLAEAGVPVDHVQHPGLVHGFIGMGLLSPDCAGAAAAAADRLRAALHG